jgi:phosphopantothenoylcysteine decarboxylase/phosphopantothenate--cysteine ligase
MGDALRSHLADAYALIISAAVADYRPVTAAEQKIKKAQPELTIQLTRTTDILESATGSFVKVGFSAESENLIANASEKVRRKALDLIVANDITDPDGGFGGDNNRVVLIDRQLQIEELPLLTKYQVGHRVLDRVVSLLG